MDDKILDALNDIGNALDMLANVLKEKNSASSESGKILQSINMGKQLETIGLGVKAIKKDTEKIIKNQETLLRISNEKTSKTDLFQIAGNRREKIKDGVSAVVLIAAGVLAIGTAFKLIGQVDFLSVIALSISLPLIAMAFEKISEMKGLKPTDMKNLFFTTVTMAAALTTSSWILALIAPISIAQSLTAILIAGTFAVISYGIKHIVEGTKEIRASELTKMPLVLFTVGLSIALASQVMRFIHPLSFAQSLTAILIAGTFAVISLGIEKIAAGIKDIKPSDIVNMPKVLLSFAAAITLSSWVMNLIAPISIYQALTAILIAGTFTIVSYGIEKIVNATKKVKASDAAKLPLILVAFAGAIMLSSWLFKAITPITLEQGLTAVGIAATFALMSLSLPLLALAVKMTSIKDAFLMTAILPLLSVAIVASSFILKSVQVIDGSVLLNIAGQAIALSVAAVALGGAAWVLSKIGLSALLEGGIAILGLALVIAGASYLLSMGTYEKGNYPTLDWAEGVGLSMLAFGVAAAALGFIAMSGVGAVALLAGGVAILGLAGVIVGTSYILAQGKYNENAYPSLKWAKGVGESIGTFGVIMANIGVGGVALNLIGALLGNGPIDIAKQIVQVSNIFSGSNFTNFPALSWIDGVSKSLLTFGTIVSGIGLGGILLNKIGDLFGSGPVDLAKQMVAVDLELSKGLFSKYPSTEWAQSVTTLMSQFITMSANKDFGDYISDKLTGGPETIAKQIVAVAAIFDSGEYGNGLPAGYMKSMSDNIRLYVDLINYLQSNNIGPLSGLNALSLTWGLSKLAEGYDKLSKSVKNLSSSLSGIDIEKLEALNAFSGSVVLMSLMDPEQFSKMMEALEEKTGVFVRVMQGLEDNGEKYKNKIGTVQSVKTNGSNSSDVLQQQLSVLNSIDNKMGIVANACSKFVGYIDELRGSNNSIKNKKHMN